MWASTACYKVNGAKLLEYDTVHVGKRATHHTHVLAYHRLVLYCVTCGCYATHKHLIKLAKQCEPPTLHGKHCLEAFRQDKCPPGLGMWPGGGGATTNIGLARTGRITSRSKECREPCTYKGIQYPGDAAAASAEICTSGQVPTRIVPASMDVDSSVPPHPPTHHSKPRPSLQYNLLDLLELEESGERVEWPTGFNADRAAAYIANYDLAINIGSLYTQGIEEERTEESTTIQATPPPSCEAREESPEPGPLPQVSGSNRDRMPRPAFIPNVRPRRRCITLREYEDRR